MKRILSLMLVLTVLIVGCGEVVLYDESSYIGTSSDNTGISDPVTDTSSEDSTSVNTDEGDISLDNDGNSYDESDAIQSQTGVGEDNPRFDISSVPAYTGSAYCIINDNIPTFTASELTDSSYEYYTPLDRLGRCGTAIASVGIDIMPTEDRGSIGSVKPTGWQTVKYDFADGKYLYNRCHLIGFQLTGENANTQNLITGTRYMNVQGMLPFENMIADYVKETENHVAYRVTPIFVGNDLLARGVLMEAYSVEDDGDGICFNVFCYNVHPNIGIDYSDGDSWEIIIEESQEQPSEEDAPTVTYVLNTNTKKFHHFTCRHVKSIKPENYEETDKTRDEIIAEGYFPCGNCHP